MRQLARIQKWVIIAVCAVLCSGNPFFVLSLDASEAAEVQAAPAGSEQGIQEEEKTEEEKAQEAFEKAKQATYEMPVQSNELEGWAQGPGTYGDAAIVMDAGSGAILYAKNIDKHEFPASITKVLTALLAFQYADMSSKVVITPECMECLGRGYATIGMEEGNVISMEQAIYAMLLASSNEIAYAVGETVAKEQGQEYSWFVEQMNLLCEKLGGKNSHFVNTNGVHEEEHYTCARDMALIGKELFSYPQFFEICQTQQYVIPASSTTEEHVFHQKHEMLITGSEDHYDFVIGGKTGYTTEAENTLITMADNGEQQLVCVVLKTYSGHVYSDTRALLEYGFENFDKIYLKDKEKSEDIEEISKGAYVMLPEGVDAADLNREIVYKENDEKQAEVIYYYEGNPVGEWTVTVSDSYLDRGEAEFSPRSKEVIEEQGKAEKDEKKFVFTMIGLAAVFLAAVIIALARERKRRAARRIKKRRRRRR